MLDCDYFKLLNVKEVVMFLVDFVILCDMIGKIIFVVL